MLVQNGQPSHAGLGASPGPGAATVPAGMDLNVWCQRGVPVLSSLGFDVVDSRANDGRVNGARVHSSRHRQRHSSAAPEPQESNIAEILAGVNLLRAGQPARFSSRRLANTSEVILSLHKQAAKARNQLALKYNLVKSFQHLHVSHALPEGPQTTYNPLQTIRDRAHDRWVPSGRFLWDVSPNELAEDLSWRRTHILRTRREGAAVHEGLPPLTPVSSQRALSSSSTTSVSDLDTVVSHHRGSEASFASLSSAKCLSKGDSQLIDRLKLKYTEACSSGSEMELDTDGTLTNSLLPESTHKKKSSLSKRHHAASSEIILNDAIWDASKESASRGGGGIEPCMSSTNMVSKGTLGSMRIGSDNQQDVFTSLTRCQSGRNNRAECMAQHELEYMIAVFQSVLRKRYVLKPACDTFEPQTVCNKFSNQLKCDMVPQYLDYLSGVEKVVSSQQIDIEGSLGKPISQLRADSDRIISEVNTTLNRELRETISRLDKMETACRTACLYNYGYIILEWVVVAILRLIWLIVGSVNIARKACSCVGSTAQWIGGA